MPPKRNSTVSDQLSQPEEELLKIAVRLDCAVRQRTHHPELISDAWFEQCIDDELVRIPPLSITQIAQ
jgi:hypothetical protein